MIYTPGMRGAEIQQVLINKYREKHQKFPTVKELIGDAGITKNTFYNLKNNGGVTLATAQQLSQYLGIPLTEICIAYFPAKEKKIVEAMGAKPAAAVTRMNKRIGDIIPIPNTNNGLMMRFVGAKKNYGGFSFYQ